MLVICGLCSLYATLLFMCKLVFIILRTLLRYYGGQVSDLRSDVRMMLNGGAGIK